MCLISLVAVTSCTENTASREEPVSGGTAVAISQNDPSEALPDIKRVEDIKDAYAYVTSRVESGKMDSSSFNYNCYGERKGTVSYFSEKGQLRLIRHSYSEYSHFSAVDSYYVQAGAPFFVFHDRLAWSFVQEGQTKDDVTQSRIYLINNRPVKCLQKKFTVYTNTKGAVDPDTIANKEIDCTSLEPIQNDFDFLVKYRAQREDLECLEGLH
ncbi:hypothetical protein CA264_08365 [Pontibacter actiniarum]|uniref:Uncharacterized protein n=1 Tax=Pontibacter actiniarum TaxID=323450 RepID=A0A1X9YRD9_9BACT|nr:hypothetical protein CA264_08365 [Pontibacter actiniarum]